MCNYTLTINLYLFLYSNSLTTTLIFPMYVLLAKNKIYNNNNTYVDCRNNVQLQQVTVE